MGTRYQIVYSKQGFPIVTWANNAESAHKTADRLRAVGYSVNVWEHTQQYARETWL